MTEQVWGKQRICFLEAQNVGPAVAAANARLISAAPELLAALKECVALMEWDGYADELKLCEAAIAKSEGRA